MYLLYKGIPVWISRFRVHVKLNKWFVSYIIRNNQFNLARRNAHHLISIKNSIINEHDLHFFLNLRPQLLLVFFFFGLHFSSKNYKLWRSGKNETSWYQISQHAVTCTHLVFVWTSFLISEHRVISSSAHSIFHGLVSPGEYYMLSLLRDSIKMISVGTLCLAHT